MTSAGLSPTLGAPHGAPGLRVEWANADPPVPAARRTDIAGFVGLAVRGPVHEPVRLRSWSQFQRTFGGHSTVGWLAHAVDGFFVNGGDTCWVVRVADPDTVRGSQATLPGVAGDRPVTVAATSPGTWADGITVTTRADGPVVGLAVDGPLGREVWPNLSLEPASPRYAPAILNDPRRGSRTITLAVPAGATITSGVVRLGGGADGLDRLRPDHLLGGDAATRNQGLAGLDLIDEIAVIVVPDAIARPAAPAADRAPTWSAEQTAALEAALLERAAARRRIALLDVPTADVSPDAALAWAGRLRERSGVQSYGSLGYPWLMVTDPLSAAGTIAVPTSGHLAGIVARSDRSVGVHKAPANETVTGTVDTAYPVTAEAHARLNDLGVVTILARPGRGIRVMGARTLSLDPVWRFTNVRRLVSMIEVSLEAALGWLVFEPNPAALAGVVEREVRTFLSLLWDRGALDGARPEAAFSVRCDATTMTAQDIDSGRLVCIVELRPPVPAEVVVLRLAVTESGVQITGEQGRQIPAATGVINA